MNLPGRRATIYAVVFILFIVVFAFVLLTYTRRVDGTSMLPILEEGDLVAIQTVGVSDVHVGDIIVYGEPCSVNHLSVIHRVVALQADGFVTKGDNNPSDDLKSGIAVEPITQACLVGRVVFAVPYIERLASLPYGLNYVLAILIFLGIIISEFTRNKDSEDEVAGSEIHPRISDVTIES